MFKAFLKDSVIYAIPSFISRGMSLILVPLYTRVLSPSDYGSLDLLLAFMSIVNLTVALEVSQGVARFYASESDAERKIGYVSTALWFTLACYTIFAVIVAAYSYELSAMIMGREGLTNVFRIGVAFIWSNGLFYLIHNQFRFELCSKGFAVCTLISSLSTAGVAVWLAYFLNWGLEGLLYGMLAGALAGCAYGFWSLRHSFQLRFQSALLKEMLVFSAPLVPSGIAVFTSIYIDRIMINHYLSIADVGLYGIAFRLASVVGLVMVGFQSALMPLVYTHYKEVETPKHLAHIFRIFLAFALLTFLLLSLFASEILVLMTTPDYYASAPLVVYLVPAILLSNMYIFAPGIGIARKTYLVLWINLIGAVLNACFNWIMIPLFGLSGAAIGTLLGYFCVFSAYMSFSQRLYPVPHVWKSIILAVIVTSVLAWGIPLIDLPWVPMLYLKLLTVVLGGVVVLWTGMVHPSELIEAYNMLRRKFRARQGEVYK